MSELRQNLATGDWVVIAPERLKGKPLQERENPLMDAHPEYAERCPFCPDNAQRYPHVEIEDTPGLDPATLEGRWQVRCIENKYKTFSDDGQGPTEPTEFERDGIYARTSARGRHELVLEHPVHNRTLATMSGSEVEAVVAMILRRFRALRQDPSNRLTIYFKNHGPKSGASQLHPHAQILTSRVVPNFLRTLIEEATRFYDAHGVCVFCKMLAFELKDGRRLVYQNEAFAAYAPYAQAAPYEVHIFPKVHDSLFEDMGDGEAVAFADCLRATMRKLYVALSNPDFNLILRNPPHSLAHAPFYHWYLQIVPHTRMPGGFERGSRMMVNVVLPEASAAHLRDTAID